MGRERIEVARLHAGDIGCVAKLRNTHTNDTLSTREHPIRLPELRFPEPLVHFAVHAESRNDEEKLQQGLHRLHEEDPTLAVHYDPDTHETIVSGMGERHLDIAMATLQRKFGVKAELTRPRIAYRETITAERLGAGEAQEAVRRTRTVRRRLDPPGAAAARRGLSVREQDRGRRDPVALRAGRGPRRAGGRGAWRAGRLSAGGLPRWSATTAPRTRWTRTRWRSRWPASSPSAPWHPSAGRCCSSRSTCSRSRCRTTYLGDVLGDLSARRGQIHGTEPAGDGRRTVVRAVVPQAELHLYATPLHSMTHGHATFTRRFAGYDQVPPDTAARVIAEQAREREEANA